MFTYNIDCPICNIKIDVKLSDSDVIYFIEAHESQRGLSSLFSHNPDNTVGKKLMIDKKWTKIREKTCDEGHKLNIYATHYKYVDNEEDRLWGPVEEPVVRCPYCESEIANHEDHIFKMDSSLSMQYVLRNISKEQPYQFNHVAAITRNTLTQYDQVSTTKTCDHCGNRIHLNYSSRNLNESENYQGVFQSS